MTQDFAVVAQGWFDGERFHRQPTSFLVRDGRIASIRSGDHAGEMDGAALFRTPFLMPGMVDAHVHLFLDGGPTDPGERSAHLKKSVDELTEAARASARQSVAHGVSMVREAGDKYGINTAIKAEAEMPGSGFPHVRSGGVAMRRPKRYGAFMAVAADTREEIRETTARLAREYDEVKLILTGIIDFETGTVTDDYQFDLAETRLIVDVARQHGKRVFAHCTGLKGLEIAAQAGIGSIEHGFFMSEAVLAKMLDNDVAWCPTFIPVHWQWAHPQVMNWSDKSVATLGDILDNHARHLECADRMGVPLLMGTDAGSMGVEHGKAMLAEMRCYLDAGLALDTVLRAATSTARRRFGEEHAVLARGAPFDAFGYADSPENGIAALARPAIGWIGGYRAV